MLGTVTLIWMEVGNCLTMEGNEEMVGLRWKWRISAVETSAGMGRLSWRPLPMEANAGCGLVVVLNS